MATGTVSAVVVAAVAVVLVLVTRYARRSGYSGMGGRQVVRCRSGHVFSTIWVPGASFKAVRLGFSRFQRCPVGRHWTIVRPVKDQDLTDEDRRAAAEHHDLPIP